ncbi:MAG: Fe-S cluster assembly protein SufD [Proteobacteria bacterium]|jgi:Fe-S cluster assembly protein SufD|nr:Fe-S cluster assembly protein SufD [Pseudomonadota bacterium]
MPVSTNIIDQTEALISSQEMPKTYWDQRIEALSRLRNISLPSKKDEYWKYTDPQVFNNPSVLLTNVVVSDEHLMFRSIDCLRLVFIDGIFDKTSSDSLDDEPVELLWLSSGTKENSFWVSEFYGSLEAESQHRVPRPLAAFNSAFAREGLLLRVFGKVVKPIHIEYVNKSPTADVILHHCVKVEKEASVTLIESGAAAARFNKVIEVDLSVGSSFDHVNVQGTDIEGVVASQLFAKLSSECSLKSFALTMNGTLTRHESIIDLVGDNSSAHLAGAAIGGGLFHHDDTVFITHDALACESRQVFKKVLRRGGKGIFQGKILVKPMAQKTDGYQLSQALLLDEESQFLVKPELEIYADDVACSHGSTSGAIDEEALFYLRSRGIPDEKARELLVLAFLAEVFDEIDSAEIAEELVNHLQLYLSGYL